jgi:ABC-type amino acid transport substrate-binding protein
MPLTDPFVRVGVSNRPVGASLRSGASRPGAGALPDNEPSRSHGGHAMRRPLLDTLLALVAMVAMVAAATLNAPAALAQGAPAGDRLERIRAAGQLRVCIWPDYYGITFRNPKSGELSGIDEVLSREFAKDLGVKTVYVDTSFATFIADLLGDRCDVAMFGVGMLPERAAKVRFSQPYLRSDIWAVTTRTHPTVKAWDDIDRPGRIVAVQAGTFMESVMKPVLKHAEMVSVKPPATRERELQAGRVDVFMTDYAYSRRVLDNADWAKVMSPDRPISPLGYAYAVAPGDDPWLARVDRFVADVKKDGRLVAAARAFKLEPIVVLQ